MSYNYNNSYEDSFNKTNGINRKMSLQCYLDRSEEFLKFAFAVNDDGNTISNGFYNSEKRNVLVKIFGRMFYTDYNDELYPFFPAFLKFYSASSYEHKEKTKFEDNIKTTELTIPPEKTKSALIDAFKKQLTANSTQVKNILLNSLKKTENVSEGIFESSVNDLSYEDSLNIQNAVDQMVIEFKNKLETFLTEKDIKFSLKKQIKTNAKKEVKIKHSLYLFKNIEYNNDLIDVEIEVNGIVSSIFELLQPSLDYTKESVRLIKLYRMFGIPEKEKTYAINNSVKDWKPYDHQWTMWAISLRLNKFANLSQMGTGKTPAAVMTIDTRINVNKTCRKGKVLYIAPAATLIQLTNTFTSYAPHLSTIIVDGTYYERMTKVMLNDVDVKFINYEAFAMKTKLKNDNGEDVDLKFADIIKCIDWDLVIIDEVHKIKNPTAERTSNIINAFVEVPYKIIMSGTIAANKLYDIECPFIFLNGAKTFNSVLTHRGDTSKLLTYGELDGDFKAKYFQKSGWSYKPLPGTTEELRTLMESCSIRFEKSECMNLPDKVYEVRLIELTPEQQKLYNDLKNKLYAELSDKIGNGEKISVTHILALNMKLAEAANGWIYDEYSNAINFPSNPKIEETMEAIDDADDGEVKFLIWSQFKQDLFLLKREISKIYGNDSVEIIDGSVSFTRRADIQRRFNDKTNSLRFIVGNVVAAGTGLDLIGASYEIYFSNSFRKVERSQSEDRCHRPGMQNKLTIIDIVAKDTIDEKVIAALKTNKAMNVALTENLGFDPKLLSKDNTTIEEDNEDAVIVNNGNTKTEFQQQRKNECFLASVAMAGKVTLDEVRSYSVELSEKNWADSNGYYNLDIAIKLMAKYAGEFVASQYSEMVDKVYRPFLNINIEEDTEEQIKERNEKLKKIILDMKEVSVPTSGRGFISIHYITNNMRHIVYYENGWIYDPALTDKKEVGKWLGMIGDLDARIVWKGVISE
jgi:SNF2 family DNA or RNA helicase